MKGSARHPLGRVTLVGAGPGAPDLLTIRAYRALVTADLVLYDALVDVSVRDFAPNAQWFYVGKRAARHHISQATIHALMIRAARAGRNVVRLKSGDPFVLGRGGEEVLALGAAGIPVEVTPGVSSAVAGPASAGIPLTHRSIASGFLVLSAVPESAYREVLGSLPPNSVTVVVLMALAARGSIARFLIEMGWPTTTPAAIVVGAETPGAWSWAGALGGLEHVQIPTDRWELPGLLVIGQVVDLSVPIGAALSRKIETQVAISVANPKEKHFDYA